ncbi:MAG TPA: branched-chain amino acid ABC transporter permease [Candidimonas sp.]|nr:branched-chain amino acid ABC transporter permease [Candidimonas sp.]
MSSNNFSRLVLALGLALALYCLVMPASFAVQVIVWGALAIVIASAMRFVMLVGEFNLATGAFYGMGAYTAGYLNTVWGWPLWASIPAAGGVAGVVAVALGYTTMRTFGAYFMLISFAFSEIVRLIYIETPALGGNNGILGVLVPVWLEPYYPALVVAMCILLVIVMALVERSALGTVFRAIKNKEAVVRSVGIDVLSMRVLCLTIASVIAGIAGGLYAHMNTVISPGDFGFMLSVFALAYVKLGGEDEPVGPVIGAAVLTVVSQFLLGFGSYDQLFYGAIIVLAMLALPQGLLGRLEQVGMIRVGSETTPRRHARHD